MYKRKIYALFLCLVLIITCSFIACDEPTDKRAKFTVSYIDVGEGDCTLICFPDGKNMLIDSATDSEFAFSSIKEVFTEKSIDKIDYFVLSHPDEQHLGNAIKIINEYSVGLIFMPYIVSTNDLPYFNQIIEVINQKQIEFCYTQIGQSIVSTDYHVAFLSPDLIVSPYGAYTIFNSKLEPTKQQADDLSPVIYVECLNTRFLFCGDAGASQENFVLDLYESNYYKNILPNININLSSLDFYMLSNGGDNYGNSYNFINAITPKNAIVSVGGNNSLGHPSSTVLANLFEIVENCNLFRTDVYGTITIEVYEKNDYEVIKSLNK